MIHWGEEVLFRTTLVSDLTSSNGQYHWYCFQRFQIIGTFKPEKGAAKKFRKITDSTKHLGFDKLCSYLDENYDCQYSTEELQHTFIELNPDIEPYSNVYFKRKLVQQYGASIHVTQLLSKTDIFCFCGTASSILSDKWYSNGTKGEQQDEFRLIKNAAAVIRRVVKSRSYNCSHLPSANKIASGGDLVPELLHVLIYSIIKPSSKRTHEEFERTKKTIDRKTTTIICHSSFGNPSKIICITCPTWNCCRSTQEDWIKAVG